MALQNLIDNYERFNIQLIGAVRNNADEDLIRTLDTHTNDLVKQIAQLHSTDRLEINKQIKFFMHRSKVIDDHAMAKSDFEAIEKLIDKYTNKPSISPSFDKLCDVPTSLAPSFLSNEPLKANELISRSQARVSLFDFDHRFILASHGFADFHSKPSSEFTGKHLVDVVGETRFKFRAKAYLERCFAGEHQNYSYFIDVPSTGERLMTCQLTPHRDSDGSVRGAFFEIDDVTDKLNSTINFSLAEQDTAALRFEH